MKKSTTAILSLVLTASLMLPAAVSVSAATSATVAEIQSSVSFRSLPSTASTVYKYLKQGEQVVVLEEVNSYWYKVQDGTGAIGYISSDDKYVEIVKSATTTGKGTIVATVSFRTSPSTDAARIRYLSKGETVTITGQPSSGWYAVTATDGTKGYVSSSSEYISVVSGGAGSGSGSTGNAGNGTGSNPTSGNATIVASVSFRTSPSTDGERIRYLSKGEKVTVTGQPNDYWYAVTAADGTKGYVSSSDTYITVNAGTIIPGTGGSGNAGSGNTGSGNAGSGNAGSGNAGSGNTGSGNAGSGNAGSGNTGSGNAGSGNAGTGNTGTGGSGNSGSGGSGNGDLSQSAKIESIIAAGMKYWGTPYEFGSDRNTTTTFDCSDFVRTAFREGANVTLPADSRKQGDYVRNLGSVKTDWHQLKRGDLMFFMEYLGSGAAAYAGVNKATATITHVGIYLGDGQILHTYSTASGGVRTSVIAGSQWENRFLFGGSAL